MSKRVEEHNEQSSTKEKCPVDWSKEIILQIYKKWDKRKTKNYSGITLSINPE